MKKERETMEELKKDVLEAYLHLQSPDITEEAKLAWGEKYEKARAKLEPVIATVLEGQ